MTTRGGRGWAGDKSKRFMMVGTKDTLPAGAKTGVVAPVPINTPSLRQEIHGSQGENAAIASINRSSAAGGWGSAARIPSASAGNPPDQSVVGGKGRGRADGGGKSQDGDDVFTRHFPDLRAGLEQAERLDAVTKASSKVAPLRKPKPEPAKDQGPSLRPRAMLKPTGSEGGGSAATAAAQAAIADAVHNRVATAPKAEERRRPAPSFADEISTKSRWTERPPSQDTGVRGRGGGRGTGGRGSGSAWETNRDGSRASGKGGRGYDRGERGAREAFQDKDRRSFRQSVDRNAGNSGRARESIFGSGAHVGMANSSPESTSSGGAKTLTTTYVRQHGPPPRKVATQGALSTPAHQHEQPPATQQPTRSLAYSASTRSEYQSEPDPWSTSTETSSKWRQSTSPNAQHSPDSPPDVLPTLDSSSSQSGSYARTHGPPRRRGREGQGGEEGGSSSSYSRPDHDTGGEASSRFGGSWGAAEQGRGSTDRDSMGSGERTLSGRWKEPAASLALPPAPTNTRWKEPKDESRAGGARRWKGKEEVHTGSGRWDTSTGEDGGVDSVAAPAVAPSPSQNSSWKDSTDDGWRLEGGDHGGDGGVSACADGSEQLEQQHAADGGDMARDAGGHVAVSVDNPVDVVDVSMDANGRSPVTTEDTSPEDPPSFRGSFQQHAQPVMRNASWEPQLPRRGDLWETPGHGRDSVPQAQVPSQAGTSGSGGTSQPWSDPWGTSGFGLSASGDQGSSAMASFLGNGPGEPRKDRYLPPALRNRAPSEGNHGDSASVPSVDQDAETNPPSLPQDVASTDVSAQDLGLPSGGGRIGAVSPGGTATAKAALYNPQQQQQHQHQQAPLEEWQQGGTHTSHRAQQDQAGHPVEQQLHQRQPIHHSHQVQPAQPLHLHDQPHLDREYRPNSAGFSFQAQDRHKHQVQEPALHHQFQSDHFRTQTYHNQEQTGRASLPEQMHRPHFQPDHVQHQQFNQVQVQQQLHVPQHRIQHSLHQPQPQQQQEQEQQQQQQQHPQGRPQEGYQSGHQLPPAPVGNQVAHHARQQHQHQQDMGRQTSQAQQMHMQQQQQQMQHPPSAFMMPSQGMGYADQRGARGGGLGGLPVQLAGSFREAPQQHPSGMQPSGAYGFQSPETRHK